MKLMGNTVSRNTAPNSDNLPSHLPISDRFHSWAVVCCREGD